MNKPSRRSDHPPADLRPWAERHRALSSNKALGSSKPRGGRWSSTLEGRRFALYGRAGTWSARDFAAARQRQVDAAGAVVESHGGRIVAEYLDWGADLHCRWEYREQAASLMIAIRNRARDFDAVIVGDTKLAFADGHYWSVFPFLAFYRMPLWIPELRGPIKYGNTKHERLMAELAGPDPVLQHSARSDRQGKERDR